MNIQDAAKSGKRFRRKGQIDWVSPPNYDGQEYSFNMDELLADDWEVESDLPRYTIKECIGGLSLLRHASHDLTIAMIDSILFHLRQRQNS